MTRHQSGNKQPALRTQVDLVAVDLVTVDLVAVDLVAVDHTIWILQPL